MVTAAYLTTALWCLPSGRATSSPADILTDGRTMVRMGLGMAASWRRCSSSSATSTASIARHQPMKIAAIEAHWDGDVPGGSVFAWPDEADGVEPLAVDIPHGASLLLTHSWDGLFPV